MKSLILLGRVSYYLVALMMICVISQHPFLEAEADDIEASALLAFKSTVTDDPLELLSSWDPTISPCCSWDSVSCNNNSKISNITLVNGDISGQLVADLALLTELEYLELYGNRLHGSIPPELANFTRLKQLDLNDNQLTGCVSIRFSDMIGAYNTKVNIENNRGLCSNLTNSSCNC